MQTLRHHPYLSTINSYRLKYKKLITEYPYLKRLMIHVAIIVISFCIIMLNYIPIIFRLGSIFDFMQFMAVFGLFYGVIAGFAPYLKLESTAKPYQILMGGKEKRINQSHSSGRDLMIGVVIIVISFMVFSTYIAVFETTTDFQTLLFMGISFILFLTGSYYFIRSLRLPRVVKWLICLIRNLLSLSWWREKGAALTNLTISVSIDGRNRMERLQDQIVSDTVNSANSMETLYESLRTLNQEDYLIVSVKDHPKLYVQYIKQQGHYRLELPITKTAANQHKLKTAINLLHSKKVLKGFMFGPLQLNPRTYYYQDAWSDENNNVTGDLLAIICKDTLLQATELGLALLSNVHQWNGKTALDYTVDTFNQGWWSKL